MYAKFEAYAQVNDVLETVGLIIREVVTLF